MLFSAVPEPTVMLSYPPRPLYTNDRMEIMCNASLDNEALDIEDVYFTFGWRNIEEELQNNSRVSVINTPPTSSVLSVLPLSVLDTNITCDVIANTSSIDTIQASNMVSSAVYIEIHGKQRTSTKHVYIYYPWS